ncbi:MAG: HAMP domain-containing sensor histidine kinase, partial [Desulfobacteraceae bacterium]|nr:HAMP domain-containing sensor histidine kinase [Desulfobacteraceae bacterium]
RHEEIDRLAVTFNQMLDRIERLVVGMREMGDNIAHDLKSPVARIRGMAEISISGGSSGGDDLTLAGSTIEECDRLLEMINTMLIISKSDAGAGDVPLDPLNMADVVRGAIVLFAPLAEDKGISMTGDVPDVLMVRGDLKMLQRAVANLVDNAIKYTPSPGNIDIRGFHDNHLKMINISIKDSGIGIDPEDQPKIFNRFFRCDQSRATGGFGLGLSLARAIAHVHGGEIQVESAMGVGSVFTFRLPRLKPG